MQYDLNMSNAGLAMDYGDSLKQSQTAICIP